MLNTVVSTSVRKHRGWREGGSPGGAGLRGVLNCHRDYKTSSRILFTVSFNLVCRHTHTHSHTHTHTHTSLSLLLLSTSIFTPPPSALHPFVRERERDPCSSQPERERPFAPPLQKRDKEATVVAGEDGRGAAGRRGGGKEEEARRRQRCQGGGEVKIFIQYLHSLSICAIANEVLYFLVPF